MREKASAADLCPACNWREGTPCASISQLPPRTVINGAYLLGRVVGEGGFGITYIGWDVANRRKVAVKEYFPRTAATRMTGSGHVTALSQHSAEDYEYGLKRFSEESRVLTMFRDHPCIVSFLDFQSANGTAYLVMEFLEGKTLAAYLREKSGRIAPDAAFNVTVRILDGLREVHHNGLLHRDISPDNIFLTSTNGVKLLDFGAARFALGERSQNLSIILKPGYAPPEQYLRRGRQGPQTDLYATAATLYRAITGQVPPEALERQAKDTLQPPTRLGVTLEPHAERAILRALSLEMGDRFKTAQEFQEALRVPGIAPLPEVKEPRLPHRAVKTPAVKGRPSVYLVYAVGTLLAALVYSPFLFPGRFGLAGTPRTPVATQSAPAVPASAEAAPGPAPAPAGNPPKPHIDYGPLEVELTGGRIEGKIAFQIAPFQGHTGCAMLALVNEGGRYVENAPGRIFQILQDFTSDDDRAAVAVHFEGPVPEATIAGAGSKFSAQVILYGNPCRVEDDPVISKSPVAPVRVSP
jgi:serine/threonine protein kinase